jgi:hypothetical protein
MFLSIDTMRRASIVMRSTAATVLLSFNFVFIFSPTALAVDAEVNKYADVQAQIEQVLESTPAKKLAHRLQKLKENLTQKLPEAIQKREAEKGILDQALNFFLSDLPVSSDEVSELDALKQQITTAYQEAIESFEAEAQSLTDKNLPAIAMQRHQAALNKVTTEFNDMLIQLNILLTAEDADIQQQALDALTHMLLNTQFKRSHTAEDPTKLPWSTPDSDVRKPVQRKNDLQAQLNINPLANSLQLASLNTSPAMLLASLAAFNMPDAADLQPTIDAQITPEIQALADQLNNNVVEIYTWVHNNIRFIPSYGSIQGSQMTLETKRGNAMDTASLAIALLRASNIPARYAYGTVEMPSEKVMNWVGGVNNANAAGNLLGQGGIPNTGIIMGGEIKYFQLEHIWVEAYVDFQPSRGMKNGTRETWIPFDPSFKQYEYTEGMDLEQQIPFDAQALVDDIQASATINKDEGWVQNVPAAAIEQKLAEYQQALTDHIENQNPDATVGEVLGLQKVNILEPRPLASGLPYDHIVTTQEFSEVPNSLRHRFKYELGTNANEYSNTVLLSIDEPTVKLAGKKLALSFKPSTQEDQDIIKSYLPKPDENGEINSQDIPDTLPGYLINLIAEFSIGKQVVAEAEVGSMGRELHENLGYYDPRYGWSLSHNTPTAGEYQAIGLDLQGSSPEYAAKLQADLEATKAKLESNDATQLTSLTKQDLVGDMLDATIFSYFAMNNIQDDIAAQQANIVNYRAPSYGKFSTYLQTSYFYGTPRNVSTAGLVMDVDRVFNTRVHKDNDRVKIVNFNQIVGSRLSAMEHLIPEKMFSTPEAPAQGISAVKALAIASAQGQKIWTITQDNLAIALAAINLNADSEIEIRNGVNAGNVVTAHEQRINFNGWVGEGYTIIDPTTGAGAYKIAGGGNGGVLTGLASFLDGLSWISLAFVGSGTLSGLLGSAIGPVIALVASAINLLTTIAAWGLVCGDAAAVALFSFLAIAMSVIGLILGFMGPIGILVGFGIAIAMQVIATRLSASLSSACR